MNKRMIAIGMMFAMIGGVAGAQTPRQTYQSERAVQALNGDALTPGQSRRLVRQQAALARRNAAGAHQGGRLSRVARGAGHNRRDPATRNLYRARRGLPPR